jgi:uncharacterized protein
MFKNKNAAMTEYSFFAPLRHGSDMLEEIARVAREAGLRHAAISVIGAVSCASFGFYDQEAKKYVPLTRQGCYEVINCTGNITLKDGSPFVHAHALFGEANGAAFGGHLSAPTTVFAAELHITPLAGPPPERLFDEKTGLHLWQAKSG